ncbi:MAG: toxin-antitoxin system YwqK family antitoxin [Clostridia bacterium]|jgi:hypothetical protein|nr:toxin-antitoxin system YwqK family antitoxin [Clostridia bacterium]
MKKIQYFLIIACALCLVVACGSNQQSGSDKKVPIHELEDRDGVAYLPKADKPFTGCAYAYFTDGKTVYLKSNFVDGKQHGEYVEYFQNGQINYKYNFKTGLEDGEWIWYNEKGNTLKKANYKEGKLHGEWITWFDNGQIHVKGQYENGEEVGEWFQWDEAGNPVER